MTTLTRIASSPSTFQPVSLPGQLEPLSEQPPEISNDEPIFLECGICLTDKHFNERRTLPHENYDPQDHAKRCFAHEKRLYCSACVEELPSPKTCPICRASIITEIAVQTMPEAAPSSILPPQPPIIENVVEIHNQFDQQQIHQRNEYDRVRTAGLVMRCFCGFLTIVGTVFRFLVALKKI